MKTAKKGGDAHTMHTQCTRNAGHSKTQAKTRWCTPKEAKKNNNLKNQTTTMRTGAKTKEKRKEKEGEKKNKSV